MNPLPPRKQLEHDLERDLRKYMQELGWTTEKTHGNLYQKGWPDLYCLHPGPAPGSKVRGPIQRWVEMKRPGEGELEPTQKKLFAKWTKAGVGVWVLTGIADYHKLFLPPNWVWWLDPKLKKLL